MQISYQRKVQRDMVYTQGRCYVCLELGHKVKDCKSNYICRKCNGKHHIAICTFKRDTSVWKDRPSSVEKDKLQTSVAHSGHIGTGRTSSSMLLQTAKADISDLRGRSEIKCRIIFDSGSQRTYINKEVCDKLGLKVVREEKVVIKAFGQEGEGAPKL